VWLVTQDVISTSHRDYPGYLLGIGRNLVVMIGISAIFIVEGLLLVSGILVQSIWMCVIAAGTIAFTLYFFYVRLYQKKEARYPMAPLEGKTDTYFPRTNIPRPIHADMRRMQEKKRRFAKLKKKIRRRKK